ncbi:hypothetical protein SDC9_196737 [bioreactor metagenome]|uniref:Uncharacterized protein n=1 Tax=bioreactor metagenome TaxID=1076179 RepID=A0A645ILD2_9ZZZZ
MRQLRGIRPVPRFGDHAAMPHEQETVDRVKLPERPEKREHRSGGDAFRLRRRTRQNQRHDGFLLFREQLLVGFPKIVDLQ